MKQAGYAKTLEWLKTNPSLDELCARYPGEWATVHSHQYGTRKSFILEQLKQGRDVLFDIDYQGAGGAGRLPPTAGTVASSRQACGPSPSGSAQTGQRVVKVPAG